MSDSSATPSTPPAGAASDPTLTILWGPPPAYTGNTGTAAAGPPPVTNASPMLVNLATMQAAESGLLSSASRVVDAYNALDQQVQSDIAGGTIFGQQATYTSVTVHAVATYGHGTAWTTTQTQADTGLQQAAQQFAAQINPVMTRVLRMIADATESVGVYIALLDKAGQAYTAADKNSSVPPVTPPTGS